MQVSLKQYDVEKAIALYLESMGITATVNEVTFKAGRKGTGLLTTVSLVDTRHAPIPEQPNTVTEAPVASQEAEAPWEEPVEEEVQEDEPEPTTAPVSTSESLFG